MNLILSRKIKKEKFISYMLLLLVSLFFITLLTTKKGYSIIPMVLTFFSLFYILYLFFKGKYNLKLMKKDKKLIFSFIFYFSSILCSIIFNGDKLSEVEPLIKILFFIPLLLVFYIHPISFNVIIHIIPIGTFINGAFTILAANYGYWNFFYSINKIQQGDIATSLSVFSFVITLYMIFSRNYKLAFLYLLFSLVGFYSIIFFGTRGSLVAFLPVAIVIFLYIKNLKIKSVKFIYILLIVSGVFFSVSIKNSPLINKIDLGISQFNSYLYDKKNQDSSVGIRLEMWKGADRKSVV